MPIFQIKDKKVQQISLNSGYFRSEQELHDFFEANLEALLGVRLLEHKYDTQGAGIPDTLALDETNTPVIIEYKLGQDPAVLVQALSYFSWLKKNSKHFELLVFNKVNKSIKVNWNNPRIILIAQGFDSRTLLAVKEVGNIELITYVPYTRDILYLETVYSSNAGKPTRSQMVKRQDEEIHDLNYHIGKSTAEIKQIFYALQEKIKLLPGVNEVIDQKTGITYRTTKSFTRLAFGRGVIDILLKEPKYNDPREFVRDITHLEFGYKGRAKIKLIKDAEYVFGLIKQSYEHTL
ncbi:MAG: hypothetical protein Q8P10_00510 [bacterium]|nr:hypothetical protein [bacterium]